MNAPAYNLRPAAQATIIATAVPSGSTLSQNAQGQLLDPGGRLIVDGSGNAMSSIAQLVSAQQAMQAAQPQQTQIQIALSQPAPQIQTVDVPVFDDAGQPMKDASGVVLVKKVPSDSPAGMYWAKAKSAYMQSPITMTLATLALGAVVFGAGYYGTRYALKTRNK